ncbi:hypothetical protein TRVL_07659 [Trypanosoma vivax]|nr:hypothetical protein TRVL_07659 [Trypanosoma vivax]
MGWKTVGDVWRANDYVRIGARASVAGAGGRITSLLHATDLAKEEKGGELISKKLPISGKDTDGFLLMRSALLGDKKALRTERELETRAEERWAPRWGYDARDITTSSREEEREELGRQGVGTGGHQEKGHSLTMANEIPREKRIIAQAAQPIHYNNVTWRTNTHVHETR